MNEDDPLAALSAAAAKKQVGPRPAVKAVVKPGGRMPAAPPKSTAGAPGGSAMTRPRTKKKVPLLVPFFIGLGILALAVPTAIFITLKVLDREKPAPAREETILHPPGELFSNVKAETPATKPAHAADTDTPPP